MFWLTLCLRGSVTVEQVAAVVRAKLSGALSVQDTLLIDVRSTGEVAATGVIPTAVNIPLKLLEAALSDEVEEEEFAETFGAPKPQPGKTQVIFYCAQGLRSAVAAEVAEDLGFSGAKNFTGSFAAWQRYHGEPAKHAGSPPTQNP
ncbi:endoplasmic reticulum protein [Trypanosoma conorhini]|uniref:Endoplasmic reticulum protein n=1 Tax=Trypanosoma conorhini TaxID=83891 RepID=A0A422MNM8_9TRYP|nr:endoplasmic reticulum protein [Trypanosoma conorhini]RNE94812.1 endoplasmic reticulum protein [Trypanosoma conorhini]